MRKTLLGLGLVLLHLTAAETTAAALDVRQEDGRLVITTAAGEPVAAFVFADRSVCVLTPVVPGRRRPLRPVRPWGPAVVSSTASGP